MKKQTIKAVEMVRRIRDTHYEQLRDMSPDERIAFYRAKAQRWQDQVEAQHQKQASSETQPT
jgi:hypothetical protein